MKSNRERFETVGAKRVQKVLDSLDILSKCSNRNSYEYTEKDVKKMSKALRTKLKDVLAEFSSSENGSSKSEFNF